MKLPAKQAAILNFLKIQGGTASLSEIDAEFGNWHYANSIHYISEILTRMVRNGLLVRPKRGWYEIKRESRVFEKENPNQLTLFK